ncbi:MAG: beta-galactosidase GalA [Verrucomicrobiota bacterium]
MLKTISNLTAPLARVTALLAASVAGTCLANQAAVDASPREQLSLDEGWRFHLGDIPVPELKTHDDFYYNAKAGLARGAAAPAYIDADWRRLDLPHDWMVEQPFDTREGVSLGYRARGIGWYRRQFKLDASDQGKHLELQFDGVATHCIVWFNGTLVARNWCGYTSFYTDITPLAQYGDATNTIVLRVDATTPEGWWYEGAGIYRHTWLVKRNPVHVITDGVYANPIRKPNGTWTLPVETTLENSGPDTAKAQVAVALFDSTGKEIAHEKTAATVGALEQSVAKLTLAISKPKLWSVDEPVLYQVRTVVLHDGIIVDVVTNTCGFRTIRFDADKGFFLNDQPLKIKGTCNHQDAAGVGVAVPDSLWNFRIRRLKELGSNAYRCAHNPPAKEFLDACDRLGMLVMDENRNFNTSPEYMRQLEWMVRRDRNHPSVILWSVFNEEPMQATPQGFEMVRRMAAAVKRLDTMRPVTAAMNGGMDSPVNVSMAVDVVGLNYNQAKYDEFHRAHPNQPMTSSEDTSSWMTRGVYFDNTNSSHADSYDRVAAPWGATHRQAWQAIAARPFVAGGFVWTGFDYRGEPQKFEWPSVSSVFGIMDTCGFPKAAYYMHQVAWIDDRPVLQIVPHWNWPGREGQPIKVMVFSNVEKVELFLNGKSLGAKSVDRIMGGEWEVPYAPGKLEAVATRNGKEVARNAVETTGEPVALKLLPDRNSLAGDGADAQPVTVCAVDAQGREVPTANLSVTFAISGPGEIIGHGNGDNCSHEAEKGNHRSLFNGLAQVVVQSKRAESGTILLTAQADGLKSAEARITARPTAARPAVLPLD